MLSTLQRNMLVSLEENFLIPEQNLSFAFVLTQCGLLASRSISMQSTVVRFLNQLATLSGNSVRSRPYTTDTGVEGLRKWGTLHVITPVHWEPVASVPVAGVK